MSNTVRATISSLRRLSLQVCARRIAEHRGHTPATPWTALRKLFLQERRDWSQPGAPRVGWKCGELAEDEDFSLDGVHGNTVFRLEVEYPF